MKMHLLAAAAMSVLLAPSLAPPGAPAPPANQLRGAQSSVPSQPTTAQQPHGKPDGVWVEGHSRSGVFVPGHWQ